jgi:branched-chain amino acid transport system permease protein
MRIGVRSAVRVGIIAGITVWYLALVGMMERLTTLIVVGRISMVAVLIFLPPAVGGWVVSRPRIVAGERRETSMRSAVSLGAAAGLAGGILVSAGYALVNILGVETVRQVFISVTPTLMELLHFHMGPVAGTVALVGGMTLAGLVGGALRASPVEIRRPVTAGVASIIVFALLERVIAPALDQMNISRDLLYSPVTLGLTWGGAIAVFVLTAVSVRLHLGRRLHDVLLPAPEDRVKATASSPEGDGDPGDPAAGARDRRDPLGRGMSRRSAMIVGWLVIAGLLAVMPYLVGPVVSRILGTVGIFMLLGLGLNIVVGYAGLLDLGYVAFFAVGAYTTAVLTGGQRVTFAGFRPPAFGANLSFFTALPIVVVVAALIGVLIGAPVLRLRGDYLAIVTLGFGEIARVIFGSTWAQSLFGGSLGMSGITKAQIPGVALHFQDDARHFYYLVLLFCLVAIFVSWRLQGSRVGRAWNAMREDEQVADAMGISTTRFKLLAFAMGGAIGSLGGALFAVSIGSLTIASFQILVSITALAVIILGGLGSIPGVIVGALVLIGLPGILTQFEDYRLLIYGAVLIAIMILRPQGLVPNVRRSRELHEDERSQDQWAKHLLEEDATDAPGPTGGALA